MQQEMMFRCFNIQCHTLLTRKDHDLGRCGGCQGRKFVIATYLTDDEDQKIKAGLIDPHKVIFDEPLEPSPMPGEREVANV